MSAFVSVVFQGHSVKIVSVTFTCVCEDCDALPHFLPLSKYIYKDQYVSLWCKLTANDTCRLEITLLWLCAIAKNPCNRRNCASSLSSIIWFYSERKDAVHGNILASLKCSMSGPAISGALCNTAYSWLASMKGELFLLPLFPLCSF